MNEIKYTLKKWLIRKFHAHDYETINEIKITEKMGTLVTAHYIVYVTRCKVCGKIKRYKIYT